MTDALVIVDKAREVHPRAHKFEPVSRERGAPIVGWSFVPEPAGLLFQRYLWVARNGEISRDAYTTRRKARRMLLAVLADQTGGGRWP